MKRALIGVGTSIVVIGAIAYATTTLHGPVVLETRPLHAGEVESGRDEAQQKLDMGAIKNEQIASAVVLAIGATLAIVGMSAPKNQQTS